MKQTIQRKVATIHIIPIHGIQTTFASADAAIAYVTQYSPGAIPLPLVGYQLKIRFTTGEEVEVMLDTAPEVVAFLQTYSPIKQ